jgi:hypothetical protein
LTLHIRTDNPQDEVAVLVRSGHDVELSDDGPVADHFAIAEAGNLTLTITRNSHPPLTSGEYYVAFAVFTTGRPVAMTLSASLDGSSPSTGGEADPTLLQSGVPVAFSLPAVSGPTLFMGDYTYRIEVPNDARELRVQLWTETAGADLDLFVRYGREVEVTGNQLMADFASEGMTGDETIVIRTDSTPPLRSGVYFINLASYSGGAATGTLTATIGR